jgi:hypothetical protein
MKKINPDFDALLLLDDTIETIEKLLVQRIIVVQQGFEFCQTNDCQQGTPGYDAWSTPARDERISKLFSELRDTVSYFSTIGLHELWGQLESLLKSRTLRICDYDHTLYTIREVWSSYYFSSQPFDPLSRRWACETLKRYER